MASDFKKQSSNESEDFTFQSEKEKNLFGEPEHVMYWITESSIRSGHKNKVCKKAPTKKSDSKNDIK